MKRTKQLISAAGLSLIAVTASAQLTFNGTTLNNPIKYWDQGTTSGEVTVGSSYQGFSVQNLQVSLHIQSDGNAWNGDYYIWLTHTLPDTTSTVAVLLNRVGKDGLNNSAGYYDTGMNITLVDTDPTDIHTYHNEVDPNGGFLTGTFASDGRTTSPNLVSIADPRTATLSIFNGQTMAGTWTIAVADYDINRSNHSTLNSWGLTFTNVPEPSEYALLAGIGLIGFAAYRRFSVKMA